MDCRDGQHVASHETFPWCECGEKHHHLTTDYNKAVAEIEAGNAQFGTFLEEPEGDTDVKLCTQDTL